jgi:hypothetical protein
MIKNSSVTTTSEPILASEKPIDAISRVDAEKILEQLQKNEKLNSDILKSVKFIKNYFAWQSVMSTIKYSVLVAVIVLGVVSWNSIVDYTRQTINSYLVGVQGLNK